MPKVRNPATLSGLLHLEPARLDAIGVFNPTLAIDTKLFVDPLLFSNSRHREIRVEAVNQYRQHFETVIKFLVATTSSSDVAWRTARRLLEFHELPGTCLGYGANSITGSGFGAKLTERYLQVAKQIVDLGIRDPDLFPAMALFEEAVGADRISDMATNIVRGALATFNGRVIRELGLKGELFELEDDSAEFLANPYQKRRTPIILVPTDILRKLPIAHDWDDIADAANKNSALRRAVSKHIGHIWAAKTRRDKNKLRTEVLASRDAFQALLDAIHCVPLNAYSTASDPDGLVLWAQKAPEYTARHPLRLRRPSSPYKLEDAFRVVIKIVAQFRHLIEQNGLSRELYKERGVPRHESTAQRLFFAIAHSYCQANNLDLSPEVDTGSGKIDFKLSRGFEERILVEVKLSTNSRLVSGYRTQLETYKAAEQTTRAIYLVIDVGGFGSKHERLLEVRNDAQARRAPLSRLEIVDGVIKPTASKR